MRRNRNRAKFFLLMTLLLASSYIEHDTQEATATHPPRYATVQPAPAMSEAVIPAETPTARPHFMPSRNIRIKAKISRYNSEQKQTDDTPTVTAACTRTRPGVIAVSRDLQPMLPYGTRVRFRHPALEDKVFVVEDLMGKGIEMQFDIWTRHKHDALRWGIQSAEMTVLPGRAKLNRVPCD